VLNPLWREVLSDLWGTKARAVLMVLSAEGRRSVTVRVQVGPDEWQSALPGHLTKSKTPQVIIVARKKFLLYTEGSGK
jgi:hypothetical protein